MPYTFCRNCLDIELTPERTLDCQAIICSNFKLGELPQHMLWSPELAALVTNTFNTI